MHPFPSILFSNLTITKVTSGQLKFVDKLEIVFNDVIFDTSAAIIVLNNKYDSIFDVVKPSLKIKGCKFTNNMDSLEQTPEQFVCNKKSDTFIHVHRTELVLGMDEIIGNTFESLDKWNILLENSTRVIFNKNEIECIGNGSIIVENVMEVIFDKNFFGIQTSSTPIHATCVKQNVTFTNNKVSHSKGSLALLKCPHATLTKATITTTTYLHPCHCSNTDKTYTYTPINTITDQLYKDQEETALCLVDGNIDDRKKFCDGTPPTSIKQDLDGPNKNISIKMLCLLVINVIISFLLVCFITFNCYYFVCRKKKVNNTTVKVMKVGRKETFENLFIRTSCDFVTNIKGSP